MAGLGNGVRGQLLGDWGRGRVDADVVGWGARPVSGWVVQWMQLV